MVLQWRCCRQGNVNGVEAAVQGGAILDQKDQEGRTALHYASAEGHLQVIELLLHYDADLNVKSSMTDDDG